MIQTYLPHKLHGASLVVMFAFVLAACAPQSTNETDEKTQISGLAYVGATIVDGTGEDPIENGVLVVDRGRLTHVGDASSVSVPPDMQRVDVSGQWIVPGLIDTHIHFMESGRPEMDKGLRSLDPSLSEEADVAWIKSRLPYTLSRYLCSGVTTVLSVGGPIHIEFGAKKLAARLEETPRVLVAGGPIANSGFEWVFDGEPAVFWADTEQQMREKVREFASHGADAIKLGYVGPAMGVQTEVTPEAYAPIMRAAAKEAQLHGLPIVTHVMMKQEFEAVLDTGLDAFAHLAFDAAINDAAVEEVVAKDIAVAPTISVFTRMIEVFEGTVELTSIERQCADPEVTSTYTSYPQTEAGAQAFAVMAQGLKVAFPNMEAAMGDSIRRLQLAGARFIIGSDASHIGTSHGVALHTEMQLLEQAGVTPMNLLLAATKHGAEVLGKSDEFGTLEPGKSADFLVLDADPLETVSNLQAIHTVVKQGRAFEQSSLRVQGD